MSEANRYTERGLAFFKGKGVANDYEQAYYWLSKACELGSEKAAIDLDYMREMSLGVPYGGEESQPYEDVRDAKPKMGRRAPAHMRKAVVETPQQVVYEYESYSQGRPVNPNRCIGCGMESLIPSTVFEGATYCSPSKGGCGTNTLIPVYESGLNAGVALQPYREASLGRRETTYSSLGMLVHMVKYDKRVGDELKVEIVKDIVSRIVECGVIDRLTSGNATRNLLVVPAPSSRWRKVQPVTLLAQLISEQGYGFARVLIKRSNVESKNRPTGTELEAGDIRCNANLSGRSILLVDDTYGEGATLRACLRALSEKGAKEIYFLSICKNIFGGMKAEAANDENIY